MCTAEECRLTFEALKVRDPEASRALRLDQARPNCCCQLHSVSEHSDGPVQDAEILIRVLVAPQHMRGKRQPKPAALSDAERNGLSMFREGLVEPKAIRDVAEGLVQKARLAAGSKADKAGVFGVLRMQCAVVRQTVCDPEERSAYGVYDTALEGDKSHTEAFQRVADASEDLIEARRRHLFAKVEATFIPVDEFMNGLLSDLAPKL